METYLIPSSSLAPALTSEKNNRGAAFTIKSKSTGKDYTYKIIRSFYNERWYTHVKVETGYLQFKRLGTYFKGHITNKQQVVTTPSAVAIAFVLDKVENNQFKWLDTKMEVMHLGKCLCCGRALTDSESIQRGVGPVCARH